MTETVSRWVKIAEDGAWLAGEMFHLPGNEASFELTYLK
jgi:hypothetical protein